MVRIQFCIQYNYNVETYCIKIRSCADEGQQRRKIVAYTTNKTQIGQATHEAQQK